MSTGGYEDDDQPSGSVATKTRTRTERPSLYKVLLLNDDYTPMEFVIHVLERFFGIITEVVIAAEPLFYVRQDNVVLDGIEALESIPSELATHDFVDLRWAGSEPRIIVRRWDLTEPPGRRDVRCDGE